MAEYEENEELAVIVDGVFFSKHFETNGPMKDHLAAIKQLEMRPDDVIVCAFPKSGTHWMWEIANMLKSGKAEYQKHNKQLAMMEATSIDTLNNMASPRVFNTHLPAFMLPAQVIDKKVKVIHVYRNVKDVFVSLYFHFRQYPGRENLTLERLFSRSFFSPKNVNGNYFSYLNNMDSFIKHSPGGAVFKVAYEDMIQDAVSVVRELSEFLGVGASSDLCEAIVRATSLTNMRQAEEKKQQHPTAPLAQMYRKGQVGDWKNHLTVAQSDRLDQAMSQLHLTDYTFTYTL